MRDNTGKPRNMSLDPTKRLRFGTTKSRRGCLRCKAGHRKCDEARPSCGRCSAHGRECVWPANRIGESKRSRHGRIPSLTLLPAASEQEQRAFEYFALRTSPQLVGTWGASVWTTTIIQCAVFEPAIQTLSSALGALHYRHDSGEGSQQYALAKYISAIRMVRDSMDRLSACLEVLLLLCLLFCAFECMNYHLDSAMSHLSSGMALMLRRAVTMEKKEDFGLRSFVLPALRMLDTDRLCLGAAPEETLEDATFQIPNNLSGLQEAQELLTHVLNLDHRQLAAVSQGRIPIQYAVALRKTHAWMNAFDSWLTRNVHSASEEEIIGVLPTVMWRTVIDLILKADFTKGEMTWDAMLSEFECVVKCAEHFMDLTAEFVSADCWKHPVAYINEPAYMRCQQTMTVHQRAEITEGLLAGLLSGPAKTRPTRPSPPIEEAKEGSEGFIPSISFLLRRARSMAQRRGTTWSSNRTAQRPAQVRPTFTVSHGIVYPLFAVMVRCRDPHLRRQALQILEQCNRHEGLWDAKLAAQSAKRLMMVEESGAKRVDGRNHRKAEAEREITSATQIPNHCRVRATGKAFLPNGIVRERYCFGWKGSLEDALASGEKERWMEIDVAYERMLSDVCSPEATSAS